jgi:hypothetical protein
VAAFGAKEHNKGLGTGICCAPLKSVLHAIAVLAGFRGERIHRSHFFRISSSLLMLLASILFGSFVTVDILLNFDEFP